MKFNIITFCFLALLLIAHPVDAASLSPSVTEIDAQRGENISKSFSIINASAVEQSYYLDIMKFEAQEDAGSPRFIQYNEDHEGLAEWITFSSRSVSVPANSRVDVPYKINVPQFAEAGGHYAAITVSLTPSDVVATNGAIIDAKTAMLILMTIKGATVKKAGLLDFTSDLGEVNFRIDGRFDIRLQNQGNVHLLPTGTVKIVDFFGRELLSKDLNTQKGRVLPGSTRKYTVDFTENENVGLLGTIKKQWKNFAIGPVLIGLELDYGADTQIVDEIKMIYLPWQLMILVLLVIVWGLIITKAVNKQR